MSTLKLFIIVAIAGTALACPLQAGEDIHAKCCEKAKQAGKECEHPCCVDAKKKGEVCTKCGGKKDDKKKPS